MTKIVLNHISCKRYNYMLSLLGTVYNPTMCVQHEYGRFYTSLYYWYELLWYNIILYVLYMYLYRPRLWWLSFLNAYTYIVLPVFLCMNDLWFMIELIILNWTIYHVRSQCKSVHFLNIFVRISEGNPFSVNNSFIHWTNCLMWWIDTSIYFTSHVRKNWLKNSIIRQKENS